MRVAVYMCLTAKQKPIAVRSLKKCARRSNMIRRIILVLIPIVIVFGLWLWYKEGSLPVNQKDTTPVDFVVKKGETVNEIAKNLETQKLIRNKVVFYLMVKKLGIETKIQAGDFRLNQSMTPTQIVEELTHGGQDAWVTVIEGLRREEIAAIFAKSNGIAMEDFMKASVPEGYLFPDSYLIPRDTTPAQVVAILRKTFDTKAMPVVKEAAAKTGLSNDEVVTLASLVEREARTDESRQMVAGILLNRLKKEMPLQVDATVQYALGYQKDGETWWKRTLSLDDLKIDSPYNTYTNTGLPPGAIASPSLSAIMAVRNAEKSPYLFYITGKDNKMHYATTYEEHQKNIQRYGVQ